MAARRHALGQIDDIAPGAPQGRLNHLQDAQGAVETDTGHRAAFQ